MNNTIVIVFAYKFCNKAIATNIVYTDNPVKNTANIVYWLLDNDYDYYVEMDIKGNVTYNDLVKAFKYDDIMNEPSVERFIILDNSLMSEEYNLN